MVNSLNYQNLRNQPDLTSTLKALEQTLLYNKLNCVRVGIVDDYAPDTRIAKVIVANKLVLGLNDDGAQITKNYAPIYAKVLFFGWADIGITHPILKGMEGILLFNDRELESWFINGNINDLAHNRAHSKTDAIFICGLLSMPNMIATLQNCINLQYKTKNIQISENGITINGDLTVNGTISATGDIIANGISLLNHVHGNGNNGADTTKAK